MNPSPPHARIFGAVLAGGRSSRLGRDKALERLWENGPDLLTRNVELLRGLVENGPLERFLVAGREHPGCESVPDTFPGRGPLGGIASALAHLPGAACLVLSCDFPFMGEEALRRLIAAYMERPAGAEAVVYRDKRTGRRESLAAVYAPETLPRFLRALEEGTLAVRAALPDALVRFLDYDEREARNFFNVNTRADLEEALRIGRGERIEEGGG